jgi:hypothetical protein
LFFTTTDDEQYGSKSPATQRKKRCSTFSLRDRPNPNQARFSCALGEKGRAVLIFDLLKNFLA